MLSYCSSTLNSELLARQFLLFDCLEAMNPVYLLDAFDEKEDDSTGKELHQTSYTMDGIAGLFWRPGVLVHWADPDQVFGGLSGLLDAECAAIQHGIPVPVASAGVFHATGDL